MEPYLREHLKKMVEYLYHEERRGFFENPVGGHIFLSVGALALWLEGLGKAGQLNEADRLFQEYQTKTDDELRGMRFLTIARAAAGTRRPVATYRTLEQRANGQCLR